MNKDYILKLEQELKQQENIISQFQKDAKASIKVFNQQKKTIERLNSDIKILTDGHDRLQGANSQLNQQAKANQKQIKELQKEIKSLEKEIVQAENSKAKTTEQNKTLAKELSSANKTIKDLSKQNTSLIEKYTQLENNSKNTSKLLASKDKELTSCQEKNQILEDKIEEWETEKEEILSKAEQARNEQAETIAELETEIQRITELLNKSEGENTQLDTDLNKAVDLLEAKDIILTEKDKVLSQKDKTISKLEQNNSKLTKTIETIKNQAKSQENTNQEPKTFTCSHCQQEWSTEFLRLVDPKGNKTCAECLATMLELTKQETQKEIILETKEKEPQPIFKNCQFCSKSYPEASLKPRHILNLLHHDPREIILICSECLYYRAKKADYYCPRTSEGKDLYEGKEYDCYCPTNLNQRINP